MSAGPQRDAQPRVLPLVSPMLVTIGPLPGPDTEGEYAYETLFNGARVVVHLPGDGTVLLLQAGCIDVTAAYPELRHLPELLPRGVATLLDGEIVTLDEQGRPSVEGLQERMSLHHPGAVARAARDIPAQLVLYDILHLGEPTLALPYTHRRALLDDLALTGPGVTVPSAWPAMAAEALRYTRQEGWDGIVAKRLTSPYLPGRRSRDWIKVKNRAML